MPRLALNDVALLTTFGLLIVGTWIISGRRYRARLDEAVRLARTDDLTGLANRRALLAALSHGLAGDAQLALMLLDIDDFKEVNDNHGHVAGDQVLRVVATRLRAAWSAAGPATGPSDHIEGRRAAGAVVARLGGDEFAVLMPGDPADPDQLMSQAHRVRAGLGRPMTVGSGEIAVQVSIGVTTRTTGDQTPTDLLRRADQALYRAKAGVGLGLGLGRQTKPRSPRPPTSNPSTRHLPHYSVSKGPFDTE
jgi:PleD family two-component response regulator